MSQFRRCFNETAPFFLYKKVSPARLLGRTGLLFLTFTLHGSGLCVLDADTDHAALPQRVHWTLYVTVATSGRCAAHGSWSQRAHTLFPREPSPEMRLDHPPSVHPLEFFLGRSSLTCVCFMGIPPSFTAG